MHAFLQALAEDVRRAWRQTGSVQSETLQIRFHRRGKGANVVEGERAIHDGDVIGGERDTQLPIHRGVQQVTTLLIGTDRCQGRRDFIRTEGVRARGESEERFVVDERREVRGRGKIPLTEGLMDSVALVGE